MNTPHAEVAEMATIGVLGGMGLGCGTAPVSTWATHMTGVDNLGLAAEYVLFATALTVYTVRRARELCPEYSSRITIVGVGGWLVVTASLTATFVGSGLSRVPAASLFTVMDTFSLTCVGFFTVFTLVVIVAGIAAANDVADGVGLGWREQTVRVLAAVCLWVAGVSVFLLATFCAGSSTVRAVVHVATGGLFICWALRLVSLSGKFVVFRRAGAHTLEGGAVVGAGDAQDRSDRGERGVGQFAFTAFDAADGSRRQGGFAAEFRLSQAGQYPQIGGIRRSGVDVHYGRDRDVEGGTHAAQYIDLGRRVAVFPVINRDAAGAGQPRQGVDGHVAAGGAQRGGIEAARDSAAHDIARQIRRLISRHFAVPPL